MIRLIELLAVGVTDDSGNPVDSGQVYTYEAGTSTLKTVYQDFAQEEPHPNPLTLDGAGRAIAYAEDRIKLVIQNADGETIRTIDNVGTADADVAQAAIEIAAGSGLVEGDDNSLDVNVDDDSLEVFQGVVQIKDGGVATAKIADLAVVTGKLAAGAVTRPKLAALGQVLSDNCGNAAQASEDAFTDINNLSIQITTSGRPVFLTLVTENSFGKVVLSANSDTNVSACLAYFRDSTQVAGFALSKDLDIGSLDYPPGAFTHIDTPSAGTYTYKVKGRMNSLVGSGRRIYCNQVRLLAFEL